MHGKLYYSRTDGLTKLGLYKDIKDRARKPLPTFYEVNELVLT